MARARRAVRVSMGDRKRGRAAPATLTDAGTTPGKIVEGVDTTARPLAHTPTTPGDKRKAKKQRKKKWQIKSALDTPFEVKMTSIPESDRNSLLESLHTAMESCKRARRAGRTQDDGGAGRAARDARKSAGVVVGVNEVTRALERDACRAVVVCKDARPTMLVQHLPLLAATRRVPLCVLSNASVLLGNALGMRSVIALGFLRGDAHTALDGLVAEVQRVASVPRVPWLDGASATRWAGTAVKLRRVEKIRRVDAQKHKRGKEKGKGKGKGKGKPAQGSMATT